MTKPKPIRGGTNRSWWVFLIFGILATLAGLTFYLWLGCQLGLAEHWGPRGDAIAPFTALLTALALFAAVVSVRFQSEELRLTREEMTATRLVQENQEKAQHRLAQAQEEANRVASKTVETQVTLVKQLEAALLKLSAAQQGSNKLVSQQIQVQRLAALAGFQQAQGTLGQLARGSPADNDTKQDVAIARERARQLHNELPKRE